MQKLKLMAMLLMVGLHIYPVTINATESEAILFLENQLGCVLPPMPLQTIHKLANEGLIEKKAFDQGDSVSSFKVKKAFKVFGMPVGIVSAFDEGDRDDLWQQYFYRAPGTSPGHFISVTIYWSMDKVKKHIIENEIINLKLLPEDFPHNNEKPGIEIVCHKFHREDMDIFRHLK